MLWNCGLECGSNDGRCLVTLDLGSVRIEVHIVQIEIAMLCHKEMLIVCWDTG